MNDHSTAVVNGFYELCNRAYATWCIHNVLFVHNSRRGELERSAAGKILEHLSIISQESILFQISKLHDPAIQQGRVNLGVEYMVRFGGWDESVEAELQALQMKLDELAKKIRPARHKILSHNDLETILNDTVLGAFPEGEDVNYFNTLQEFVNIIHDRLIGGSSPFTKNASSDATLLLSLLKT